MMLLEWSSYVEMMSPASLAIAVLLAIPVSVSLIFLLDSNALFITSAIRRVADALSSSADFYCSFFAPDDDAPSSSLNNNLVLRCPGVTMRNPRNKTTRTTHIPVLLRCWTKLTSFGGSSASGGRSSGVASPHCHHYGPGGFWPEYKKIADELTGLFGPLHSYEFPEEGKILQPFVALADEAPYVYSKASLERKREKAACLWIL